jgi:hypothetical protein
VVVSVSSFFYAAGCIEWKGPSAFLLQRSGFLVLWFCGLKHFSGSLFIGSSVLNPLFLFATINTMRNLFFSSLFSVLVLATACGDNNSGSANGKPFCDTACKTDSLHFKGDHKLNPMVDIGLNACRADTVIWTHDLAGSKLLSLRDHLGQDVYLNPSSVDCYIKDTSYAWLQFNDCKTGRGFLLKLPFNKADERRKITAAFTKFDPKFSIDPELVAYTDRGSVFVENIVNGKKATMPFDKAYDIDFNKMHEMVDSVIITKDRIFVQMIREGQKKPYEKKVSLQ